jgi:HNH endonuclease
MMDGSTYAEDWGERASRFVEYQPTPREVFLDQHCEVFCLVSPEDHAFVTQWRWSWKWNLHKRKRYAYRTSWRDGRRCSIYLHKALLNHWRVRQPSEAHTIGDHIDGDSTNNQRDNLRWATPSENAKNRRARQ